MTPPEHPPLDDLRADVADLQRERVESRDHRTRVQTLLTLAGAAALLVVAGAVTPPDHNGGPYTCTFDGIAVRSLLGAPA